MRAIFIFFGITTLCSNSFGQFMGYLTQLEDSDRESAFAEITLVHRYRPAPEDFIYEVGSTSLMLPKIFNGKEIKIDHSRFRMTTGDPFIRNNKAYIQVFLFYDNKTIDPRDDIFIIALPFQVDKELIDSELQHYEGQEYVDYNFITAKKE